MLTAPPAGRSSWAPSSLVNAVTGDPWPSNSPTKTRSVAFPCGNGSGAKVSKNGATPREASGSAIQSCTPCRVRASSVETSECWMPAPAVMRLTCPGSTMAWCPAESRCSISPW